MAYPEGYYQVGECLIYTEPVKIRWVAMCGVCENWFEHPEHTIENPSPHGTFCPVCREKKLMAPGVLNWIQKDVEEQ